MGIRPIRVSNRRINDSICRNTSDFTFVQLADSQLGLLERYVEKRQPPYKWDRELTLTKQAVELVNKLDPQPKFVIVCGDLIDAQPGNTDRPAQYADLIKAFEDISPNIPVLVLPGNHDVGDNPSSEDIKEYQSMWGDDYYSFFCGNCKFIVVNSQLYWDDCNCSKEAVAQNEWLTTQLTANENENYEHLIVFQHIPLFSSSFNEADGYFNIPMKHRLNLLQRYYQAGVRFVFTGHLHRNSITNWLPNCDGYTPLSNVSSSAVGVQLGDDQSGLRVIHVSSTKLMHNYINLN